jgi:pantoate--beta-alanine ligase
VMSEGAIAIEEAGFALDYFEARHAASLGRVETRADGPIRLLVAARLGKTRLIDNIAVGTQRSRQANRGRAPWRSC